MTTAHDVVGIGNAIVVTRFKVLQVLACRVSARWGSSKPGGNKPSASLGLGLPFGNGNLAYSLKSLNFMSISYHGFAVYGIGKIVDFYPFSMTCITVIFPKIYDSSTVTHLLF